VAQFQIECVESKTESNQSQYSKFILEPLERGQGVTIGNSLRRVLLSNLEGTCITAVRVAGLIREEKIGAKAGEAKTSIKSGAVNHEFATLVGVRQDVLELLLNMKEVKLKSYTSQPQIGRLNVIGPAEVTTADFELPSEVEVVDPNQYVATVAEGGKLEMEFRIERGKGYRSVDKFREHGLAMDMLQIDAVFMPVTQVNYTTEDVRIDGAVEKDRLILEIWTNGSLTPQEALSESAKILVDLLNPLKDISLESFQPEYADEEDPSNQIPIEELNLSVRAYNCLKRAQINSVSDLMGYTQEDLLEIKNFGLKSAEEVIEALEKRLGIKLAHDKSVKV
jgi:DNA-directed RNA polymerase subunit alpha